MWFRHCVVSEKMWGVSVTSESADSGIADVICHHCLSMH